MASILLAFVIDAWWDDRQLLNAEVRALEGIRRDLRSDSVDVENFRTRMRVWDAAGLWIDQNLGADVPVDSASARIRPLFSFTLYQPVRATYVGLRDSGSLGLVSNAFLRDEIIRYFEESQLSTQQWMEMAMIQYHRTIDASLGGMERRSVDGRESMRGAVATLQSAWRDLNRGSPLVAEALLQAAYAAGSDAQLGQVLEQTGALIRQIDAELGDSPSP